MAQETQATSGPTAKPPRDPQPTVDRIDELARRILSGDILLPKFQRSFVWERGQILDLLDSIARNFPIGSVLLWQSRQDLRSERRIAELEIDLPRPDYPVNYLLDGQQRLSTICGALYWKGRDPKSRWNLAFDLRTRTFVHLDSLDDPPPHQIRVNKLSEPAQYFAHVSAIDSSNIPDKASLKLSATQLFDRFKDYKIAAVTLGDMSIQDVAPIFERINSSGTALTIVDLMRAATWSQEFDLIDSIEAILGALASKGFSDIDKRAILRNFSAAVGGEFSADSIDNLRKHSPEKLKEAAEAVMEAYKLCVDLLSTDLSIPNDGILPYMNQAVVLAESFRLLPRPTGDQRTELQRWFWKTAVTGYFGGWNTGQMSTDRQAVADFAAGRSNTIAIPIQKAGADTWLSRSFRMNNARSAVLALVLAQRTPRDLLTGQKIDLAAALSWVNSKEFHHFFPQDYLKTKGRGRDANTLANIIYLTSASNKEISNRAPSDYLREAEARIGAGFPDVLASNYVSQEAYKSALADDFDRFAALRAKTIADHVDVLAGWK